MTTKARKCGRILALLLAVAGPSVASSARADEASDARAEARQAAQQGTEAFKEKRFQDALDALGRAEDLVHAPTHLLMMARSHLALGALLEARRVYRKITAETVPASAPPAFARAKKDAEAELAALEPRIPQVLVEASPRDAKGLVVLEDDKPLAADALGAAHGVDPGAHTFRARADGMHAEPVTISLGERGKESVELDLVPDAKPAPAAPPKSPPEKAFTPAPPAAPPEEGSSTLRPLSIGTLAFGSASLALGLALFPIAQSKQRAADAATKKCGGTCTAGEAGDARRMGDNADSLRTASTVGLVAGGALLTTGFVLLVASAKQSEAAPAPRQASDLASVRPVLGLGSVGASGTF